MPDFEDFYEILGVPFDATQIAIKDSYVTLCQIWHPDRFHNASESVKKLAEEKQKQINSANDTLKDPDKRKKYDQIWRSHKGPQPGYGKPKPIIDPPFIEFTGVKAKEVQNSSFVIINGGGKYNKISIIPPLSPWVTISNYYSLTASDELPMKVEITATGDEWDKDYSEFIEVKLDDETGRINIHLHTIAKAAPPPPPPKPSWTSPPQHKKKGIPTLAKYVLGIVVIGLAALGIIQLIMPSMTNTKQAISSAPTATMNTPTPTNTYTKQAEQNMATLTPTTTTKSLETKYKNISLLSIANAGDPKSSTPDGIQNFKGIPFSIQKDKILLTNYGAASLLNEAPLDVDIPNVQNIYILINTTNTFRQFLNKQAGKITLVFDKGSPEETHLIAGSNIREYTMDTLYGDTVRTVTDPNSQIAWQGTNGGRLLAIDMLTIRINSGIGRSLRQIIITDTSNTTTGSSDPGLIVWGLTVSYKE